jgi:hypothetical protein
MCSLGKSDAEMLQALHTACADNSLLKTVVYYWYIDFRSGQGMLRDELHSGRPSTSVNAVTVERERSW